MFQNYRHQSSGIYLESVKILKKKQQKIHKRIELPKNAFQCVYIMLPKAIIMHEYVNFNRKEKF